MRNLFKRAPRKTLTSTEAAVLAGPWPCSICNKPAVLKDVAPGVDPLASPGMFRVNQTTAAARVEGSVTLPVDLRLCTECLVQMEQFMAVLVEQRGRALRQQNILDRLGAINAGNVVTMVEEEPRALPSEEVRTLLEGTPYGGIWSNGV